MTPRTRTVVVFSVVATVVVTGFTGSRLHNERLRREGFARAQKLKDDIDRYFPTGTPRRQFAEWSDKWTGWHGLAYTNESISIGQIPSDVWYCAPGRLVTKHGTPLSVRTRAADSKRLRA